MVASHGWYADITTNEQSKKGQKVEQIDYHHKSYQVIVLRLLIGLIAEGSKKERHFFPPFRIPFNNLYIFAPASAHYGNKTLCGERGRRAGTTYQKGVF